MPTRATKAPALLAMSMAGALLTGACAPSDGPPAPRAAPPDQPTGVPRPGSTPSAVGVPETACPESGVRITSLGVSAAMGLRALGLELVNCGTRPYRLHGYPALRLRDGDGEPIPVRVVPGAKEITSGFDDPPRPLVLAPGEAAGAAVLWRNLVTDPTVVATNARHLAVAPAPGQHLQEVDPHGGIDLGNTGRIGVSAWKKRPPTTPAPSTPAPGAPAEERPTPAASLL